ncbi:LptF/LptG family permease [Glycocaulis abyssi]|uniref:LptF/LptG family permease n=1 Tax=Glycocaulis abyssi TaxID=1433403 RepID=A0ABV9NCC4_9PROT
MKLFQRYAFRQAMLPFLIALAALTGLAILTQSLSNLNLVADRGETLLVFLWVTILAVPQIVALLMPIAVFIACAGALNRMMSESELTVAAAAGLSRRERLSPFLRVAVYAMLINLGVNLFVQPAAYREMRQAIYDVRTDIAASVMRPGEFVSMGVDVTFYARTLGDGGMMSEVFIEDGRGASSTAYSARQGQIVRAERGPVMLLSNGVVSQIDESGTLSSLTFDSYEFDLTAFIDPTDAFFFKESDRYLPELFNPSPGEAARARGRANLLAEGHYRLSAPLYNLAFAMIALAAFLSGPPRRTGYARAIALAGACALIVRLTGFAVQAGAESSPELNWMQYAIPLAAIAAAYIVIHRPVRFAVRWLSPRSDGAVP